MEIHLSVPCLEPFKDFSCPGIESKPSKWHTRPSTPWTPATSQRHLPLSPLTHTMAPAYETFCHHLHMSHAFTPTPISVQKALKNIKPVIKLNYHLFLPSSSWHVPCPSHKPNIMTFNSLYFIVSKWSLCVSVCPSRLQPPNQGPAMKSGKKYGIVDKKAM